jgi:quinol-cytochrome oxidoreductase complex cytochrome b subunit
MQDEDLILEDWKMTKDRIKHFDDIVIRLRLEAVPIAIGIIGAGLTSFQYTSKVIFRINNISLNATSIVILMAALYIVPVCVLDLFHYHLLLIAVNHARSIEQQERFKGKLQITTKLTSPILTLIHLIFALAIYVMLFVASLVLAYMINML